MSWLIRSLIYDLTFRASSATDRLDQSSDELNLSRVTYNRPMSESATLQLWIHAGDSDNATVTCLWIGLLDACLSAVSYPPILARALGTQLYLHIGTIRQWTQFCSKSLAWWLRSFCQSTNGCDFKEPWDARSGGRVPSSSACVPRPPWDRTTCVSPSVWPTKQLTLDCWTWYI